ncbi:MAG: SAM-dependent methyltransferase [Bacteroidales bacterium]|nr:SAM-dependent methyltransferase [Bacteroidales bacterium]
MNAATRDFIEKHLKDDVRQLALQKFPNDVDKMLVLNQIEARQLLSKKVPSWASNPDLLFPKHLSIEQCSSELTAKYKASIIEGGDTFVDLTGGLGIDSYFLSEKFKTSYYVENQKELCDLAEHNFDVLGRRITVVNSDAETFLNNFYCGKTCLATTGCDNLPSRRDNACIVLYIDPARRDIYNRKMVSLHDCSPDVIVLQRNLYENLVETRHGTSLQYLIKASPMLDISLITNELKNISEIHIVAVKNECKEVLIKIEPGFEGEIKYFCVNLNPVGTRHALSQQVEMVFQFVESEEKSAIPSFSSTVKKYLYEPNAALMKSGAFKLISQRFEIDKLHVNSHLYTSDNLVPDFPGRVFEVVGFAPFNKKIKKELLKNISEASVATRNFLLSANDLRKNLNLKESDENYVFGTTAMGDNRIIILCRKYNPLPQ